MKTEELITFFGTNCLKKNKDFYHRLLKLPIYKDQGKCLIYEISNTAKIGFCSTMEVTAKEKSPIITFVVPDVDSCFEDLKSEGLILSKEPELNEFFKIYHFFIRDPDNYFLEFQKFL